MAGSTTPVAMSCHQKKKDAQDYNHQNVNGLQIDDRGGQYDDICKTIKEIDADLFCGQEINLDTCQHAVKQILHETTNQHWQRAKIVFGLSPISFQTCYTPGGTLMVSNRDLTGWVTHQSSDKWGRWVNWVISQLRANNIPCCFIKATP